MSEEYKIGFYGQPLYEPLNAPMKYVIELMERLQEFDDIDVYYISEEKGEEHDIYRDVEFLKVGKYPFESVSKLESLDIIHFNSSISKFWRPKSWQRMKILKLDSIKKIMTVHGDGPYQVPGLTRNLYPFEKKLWRMSLVNTDRILTLSDYMKGSLLELFPELSEDKMKKIGYGTDDIYESKENAEEYIREKYGISDDFILHVSMYSQRKNPKGLLETFKYIREKTSVKLVIVGSGWKDNYDEDELDDIILTGYVPEEDLPYFYSACELFFFPSRHECFGMPNLEAMSCGAPVVTSNRYSIPEVVGDAGFKTWGFLNWGDFILNLLRDDELQQKYSKKSLERAKEFSWKESVKKFREVIYEVKKHDR